MASNGGGRSVLHNTFGDYAQIIQGDYNVSVLPPKKLLELDYLHEATFNATNKQHAPSCLENTRVQVLSQIRSWIDDDEEKRVYWLRGMAGTGKTTITLTTAREYYRQGRLGASFFFSRSSGDLSSTRRFVVTIANELAESLPAYREHLQDALESSPTITSRSLYDQWKKLILDPLRSTSLEDDLQPILIAIDALDECGSDYDLGVLIQCLADLAAIDEIPFRVFITSRPEKTIHLGFDKITSNLRQDFTLHDIEESIVAADLRLYYRHELTGMDIDESLITEETIDILAKKSDGLFIHAATVCRFIRQGEIYAATRLESFLASHDSQLEPERELDSIYATILENAFAKFATLRPGEMETLQLSYQKVVGSVVMLYDRLSPIDLATMVGEPVENITRLLKHLSSVLDVPQQASGKIYVLHSSFRDFLSDPARSSSLYFSVDQRKIHANLLTCCLDIMATELRKNIYSIREPGKRIKDISKSGVDSHVSQVLQYACKYWIHHLEESDVNPREHSGTLEFFQTRFLFWIEVLTLIGRLSDGIDMIRLLESLLSLKDTRRGIQDLLAGIGRNVGSSGTKVTHQTLTAVVQDATRFLYAHSSTIEAAPMQLYISALIFSPRTSLIRRIYQHHIPSWVLSVPSLSQSWNPQLRQLHYNDSAEVVAYSPDGQLMASGHLSGKICLWDAITGAKRRTLRGHSEEVVSLSFSPDSNVLMSASNDMTIRFWNAITGTKIDKFRKRHRVRCVAFMPDGKKIIFVQSPGSVYLWDVIENEKVWVARRTGDDGSKGYGDVTISPDGKCIACGDRDNRNNVWLLDAENGKPLHNAKCFDKGVTSVTFSPDSKLLAVGLFMNVEIWNVATGATRRISTKVIVNEVLFSPDGKTIAIAVSGATQILNVASGKKWCDLQDPDLRSHGMPQRFAFSPDGSAIASVSGGNGVIVWDTRFRSNHIDSEFSFEYPSIVAAARDDKQLASASYSDAIRLWDGQTGAKRELCIHRLRPLVDMLSNTRWLKRLVWRFKKPAFPDINYSGRKKINISSITFSMDGKFFACVWKTKKLQVWDAQNGKMLFARKLDSNTSDNVVFSPDSKLITTLSDKIYMWNTKTGSKAYCSEALLGKVESVAFSPNGKYLVSSLPSEDEDADFDDMEPSVHDNGDFHGYTHLSVTVEYDGLLQFSSNSKLLAYRFSDRIVVLNVATGEFVHSFTGHPPNLVKLSIFDDNKYLGALHSMGNVLIWDLETGSVVRKGSIDKNESSLCFSLNDKHIASLDKVFAYKTSMSANCHSDGISFTRAWIKDGGQDIVYFPHESKDFFDFMAGSALVFRWPPTGFFGEATQHLGCNMLRFAMVDKVMDED
ncbi:uncharacterized protein Triagg1_9139 [Trichoderma aggressivum f. europaeum]|uniref:Mitochondrial division protein 1 n=1 Tax=Trichoderma aggressivum f. europaeum TaxID=173218 RepID=A0AAE1M132_9HYPO|nr:hypothetical protein Triagg1_9139 [Trichoderma aggressivum f. europaeum]